jgi:epoxide hydrolase
MTLDRREFLTAAASIAVFTASTISTNAEDLAMTEIKPFRISIPDDAIADLNNRLRNTIYPAEYPAAGWKAGPTNAFVKNAISRMLSGYDWRAREAEINQHPQYVTEIDGQTIHFLHIRSKSKAAIPLLLIHGWPGSFVEYLDVIDRLTAPQDSASPAYDVVIPSLPGFGFSVPLNEADWNNTRTAKALVQLMSLLGYEKFGVQGGDAGAILGPEIGRIAPKQVIGVHLNAATLGFIPMGPMPEADIATLTDREKTRLQRLQRFMAEHFAFNMVQSMRPQALAYGITDSPAGLLAWIAELFTSFGDRPNAVELDRFLTNFMIYWFSRTAGTSTYLYYANAHDPNAWAPKANSGVPTAVAVFGFDEVAFRRIGEQSNTITRWTEFDVGGHYAVMEVPDLWYKDVNAFFSSLHD